MERMEIEVQSAESNGELPIQPGESNNEPPVLPGESNNAPPVQKLSIHMLKPRKSWKRQELTEITKTIIQHYNEENQGLPVRQQYVMSTKRTYGDYSTVIYSCTKAVTPHLAKQTQTIPTKTVTSHSVLFFHKETSSGRRIFALTCGNGWRVVRRYVNHSMPLEVAKKVADPHRIIGMSRRCIYGQNIREDVIQSGPFHLYKTSNLYYLVENFRCALKEKSSLCCLELDEEKTLGKCFIKVTSGGLLRIEKKLCLRDYPTILNHLEKIVENEKTYNKNNEEETADPRFNFLKFLQEAPITKGKLDSWLINDIYSRFDEGRELIVDIRPKYLESFFLANSFEIKFVGADDFENIGTSPPSLENILTMINDRRGREEKEEFIKKNLEKGEIKFTDLDHDDVKEKIIDFIEGPLHISEREEVEDEEIEEEEINGIEEPSHTSDKTFFKIRKMWYILEADYIGLLCEDFDNLVQNSLSRDEEGRLFRSWAGNAKGEKEEAYCRSYLDAPGYLVFDQILPEPDKVELCDIFKYTEDTIYLYHVKETFGQHTRDATSQILVSAIMIRSDLALECPSASYLKRVWDLGMKESDEKWKQDLKRRLESLGEKNFYDLFRRLKIVFVYAYLPNPQKSFSNPSERNSIEESHLSQLINKGYLDVHQNITRKFYCASKNNFSQDLESEDGTITTWKKIYTQLEPNKFSKSTIAKVELVQLAQNLRELGFELKICEIPKA